MSKRLLMLARRVHVGSRFAIDRGEQDELMLHENCAESIFDDASNLCLVLIDALTIAVVACWRDAVWDHPRA